MNPTLDVDRTLMQVENIRISLDRLMKANQNMALDAFSLLQGIAQRVAALETDLL